MSRSLMLVNFILRLLDVKELKLIDLDLHQLTGSLKITIPVKHSGL